MHFVKNIYIYIYTYRSMYILTFCHSDVTFKVQNAEFKAHRAILWARSTWFRSLIGERWHANAPSVDVRDIDPEVFSTLLDFMYTDRCALSFTCLLPNGLLVWWLTDDVVYVYVALMSLLLRGCW